MITEFLLARIAKDEEEIRRAEEADEAWPWRGPSGARAECEAKRRIVELHPVAIRTKHVRAPGTLSGYRDRDYESNCGTCDPLNEEELGPCNTLRALASVYADHPDFDEKWRL